MNGQVLPPVLPTILGRKDSVNQQTHKVTSGNKQAGVRNRPQGQRATEGEGRAEGPLGVYLELLALGPWREQQTFSL